MAASPKYKVNNAHGEYIASFKHAEDAARFVAGQDGCIVTLDHRRKLWREGLEVTTGLESIDRAAAIMWAREDGHGVSQYGDPAPAIK